MKKYFVKLTVMASVLVFMLTMPAFAKTTLRFAGIVPVDNAASQTCVKICDNVAKETKGEIEIKFYPAGQLGDYTLLYEELIRGTIDIALIPLVSQFDPKFALCSVAFLAKDYDEARKLFSTNGFISRKTDELNATKGVKFFGFNVEGFGGLGMVKKPVEPLNPEINKKLLIRTSPNDVLKFTLESMKYRTVTIPWSDLYTAMQTGVCDGWIGGTAEHNYTTFRDVIKYYHELNLYIEATSFLMSNKTWAKLKPEHQKIIERAFKDASNNSLNIAEKINAGYRKQMKDAGIEVFEYTDDELSPIFENGREYVWNKLDKILGKDLINELFEAAK